MNSKLSWLAIFLVFGFVNAQAADMSAVEEWMAKAEIKELVDRYAMARDDLDAEEFASLFTENGVLIIMGEPHTGRDVIQARIAATNPSNVAMHLMSTGVITIIDDKHATGIHYGTAFGVVPDESHQVGSTVGIGGFGVQGRYLDKYELTEDGWKISERQFALIYHREK